MNLSGRFHGLLRFGVCLLLVTTAPAPGQPVTLVKDLRTEPFPLALSPSSIVAAGSRIFFTTSTSGTGLELWASDGTEAGTAMVKDIRPGSEGSTPSGLVAVGGSVFFSADDGTSGAELWTSDGTEAGTVMVKDIWPGPTGSSPGSITAADGVVYFAASGTARELWRSDGTADGTWLVKDLAPDGHNSSPRNLAWLGGTLYFAATTPDLGEELWKSDGTAGGTVLVKDVFTGIQGSGPRSLTASGLHVYFVADDGVNGEELWRTDGTGDGTKIVRDINPDASSSSPTYLVDFDGTLYFAADDGTNGRELWKSDGTSLTTVLAKDICPACGSGPAYLVVNGATLFFTANDGTAGRELWKSDGTPAGTVRVTDLCAGSGDSITGALTSFGKKVYFEATDCGSDGSELWSSSGTAAGTAMVKDICAGTCSSTPRSMVASSSALFLSANDGSRGTQLWKSNGSETGTVCLTNVDVPWSMPGGYADLGGALLFVAADPVEKWRTLWKTDGKAAGTVQLGAGRVFNPGPPVVFGGKAYFSGDAGGGDYEIWASDGTDGGTVLLKDVRPGSVGSNPTLLTPASTLLFFVANDGTNGNELWKTDGSGSVFGTALVKDILPGSGSAAIQRMVAIGSRVFFTANDGVHGTELWVSTGTSAGTTMVADLLPGSSGSNPQSLVDVNGTLYFTATTATGTWLYRSDGSSAGTVVVSTDVTGVQNLTNVGGTLFFTAPWNGEPELWKTDGTPGGTGIVADINTSGGASPSNLVAAGSVLWFRANDGVSGAELWRSNGTAAGTYRFADLRPGAGSSLPRTIVPFGSHVYFVANDGVHGEELWKSDGTDIGTFLVQDLNPGAAHSNIGPLRAVAGRLFLSADDGSVGFELWKVDAADLSVSKSASNPSPLQGSTVTWTITVTNTGPSTATGVKVLDPLPTGLTYVSATPPATPCVLAAGTLTCDVGTISPGGSKFVEVLTTVNVGFVGTIANSARVLGLEPDPDGSDNAAVAVASVPGPLPPARLDAQPTSETTVALTWTVPASTQTEIRIDRSTDGVGFAPVESVGPSVTAFTDTGLEAGTLYYYRVVSVEENVGESSPSNVAVARTWSADAAQYCVARVSGHHTWSRSPAVAWDGAKWAVAMQVRNASKELDDIHLRFLDASTAYPTGSPLVASGDDMSSFSPTIRWNGSRYGIVWYTGMRTPAGGQASSVAFALYDSAGLRLRVNPRVVSEESFLVNANLESALSWTGSEWSLVLPLTDGVQADLYLVRISADGDRIGEPVRLTNTPETESDVSLAWGGTSHGLFWVQNASPKRVWFQPLQADGTPLAAPIVVREAPTGRNLQSTSAVADGSTWVAAWTEVGPGPDFAEWVYLAQAKADGTLPIPPVRVSSEFDPDFPAVDEVPNHDYGPQLMPRVGTGWVIFTSSELNTTGFVEIGRLRTDGAGNAIGTRTILSTDDGRHSSSPRAFWNGSHFLVAYNDGATGTQEVARFTAGVTGGPTLLPDNLTTGGSPGNSLGTATSGLPLTLAVGDGFAVVYSEPTATGDFVPAASLIDGAGVLTTERWLLSARAAATRPGGASVGAKFALAWKEPDDDVWLGLYDAAVPSALGEILVATAQAGRPAVAVAFSGEVWGVVWNTGNDIAFRRVSPAGALLGSQTSVTLASQPSTSPIQVAWTGSGWAIVWVRGTAIEYLLLDATGNVTTGPVAVSATAVSKNSPSIAWNGGVLGIAWAETLGATAPRSDILFTTVGLDGLADFTPVVAAGTEWNEANPSLYWAGDRFGLVHTWGFDSILREVGILPGGALVPGDRLLSPRGSPNSVAFNGATLGVAWSQLGEVHFETTACLADATPAPCPPVSAARNGRWTTVSWAPPEDGQSGIFRTYVYRDGTRFAEVYPSTTQVLDTDSVPGVTHAYEVRPQNGAYLLSTGCTPVAPTADLSVTKSDGTDTEVPGTSIAWTVTVKNHGPSTVTSVTLTDIPPAAVQDFTYTPAAGTYSSGTGAWTNLNLGPGQSVPMTIAGTLNPSARGTLANTATVAATVGAVDPNPANDAATDTDTLVPSVDLSIATFTDSPDPVKQGATLTYTTGITNAGPSTATGIVLTLALPPGVTFLSSTPPSPTCTHAGGTVTCSLPAFSPGTSGSVTVRVTPDAGTVGTISATASVTAAEGDPAPGNNSASTTTTVPGPVLDPIPAAIVIGGTNTFAGSGFTAGSVIKLFVSTATGPQDTNTSGWTPTTWTPTSLTWDVPADVPVGQGFATVQVVNTDEGYVASNLVSQLLYGDAADGLPTILTIGGAGLRAPDPSLPGAHVETVLAAGSTVTIGGTGFNAPVVNLFTADGNAGPLTPLPGGTATGFQVVIPAGVPAGPGTFQVVNTGTGYKVSNAVDAVLRARITVTSVSVVGSTVNVVGDGFCGLTVINLFNVQGGNVVNLGGLSGGSPVIPLTVTDAQHFSFTLPAGAQSGPAYVQALNPPYTPYTSSGTDPGGAFTVP